MADSIRKDVEDLLAEYRDALLDLESQLSLYMHVDDTDNEEVVYSSVFELEDRIKDLLQIIDKDDERTK